MQARGFKVTTPKALLSAPVLLRIDPQTHVIEAAGDPREHFTPFRRGRSGHVPPVLEQPPSGQIANRERGHATQPQSGDPRKHELDPVPYPIVRRSCERNPRDALHRGISPQALGSRHW